jgi:hypothetical protein
MLHHGHHAKFMGRSKRKVAMHPEKTRHHKSEESNGSHHPPNGADVHQTDAISSRNRSDNSRALRWATLNV